MKSPKKKTARAAAQPIPMIDLRAQHAGIRKEVRAAVERVIESQHFVLGPEGEALEREVALYSERRFAIGVASGTDAIMLGLRACGVGAGDEVIVPAFTFIATAGAVTALGARPVFAESDPQTLNVDPRSVRALVGTRTAAIVAVHLYGLAAEMDALAAIAAERGVPLVEDNAQSLGATYRGKKAGSFGAISTTSFYPSKNLGACGDAGMILTDSDEIATRLKMLRNHGQREGLAGRYVSIEQGWNSRLDEMQAAVLRVKLRRLDRWIAARRAHAARYAKRLAKMEGVTPLETPVYCEHTYYLYTVRIPNRGKNPAERRDYVRHRLADRGISTGVYYPVPLHLQPVFAKAGAEAGAKLGGKPQDLPEAERAAHEVLSLPLYPEMTTEQLKRVADSLEEALQS